MPKALRYACYACTLILQYDIHKMLFKIQYYYPDLIELQNAPLTYSLWFLYTKR